MFHWVTGIPFENDLHGGAYDDLTLWEQIDEGAQYTPAKKWLFSVPIVLCVLDSYDASIHPLTRSDQILGVNTLHKLQPVVVCREPFSTHIRADTKTPTST